MRGEDAMEIKDEIAKALYDAMKTRPTVVRVKADGDGWIECEKRLPPWLMPVEFKDSDGYLYIGRLIRFNESYKWMVIAGGYNSLMNHEKVIAWRPLPPIKPLKWRKDDENFFITADERHE